MLPVKAMFFGDKTKELLATLHKDDTKAFYENARKAALTCAKVLLRKFPLHNELLRCLSALDPAAHGHSKTLLLLKALKNYILPSVLADSYEQEAHKHVFPRFIWFFD